MDKKTVALSVEAQGKIEALQRESEVLKEMVAQLDQRLRNEKKSVLEAHHDSRVLRYANGKLVQAAFDAEDARIAADAAIESQSVFLSMLAHELRNPMASIAVANSVIGMLEIEHPRLPKLLGIVERQSAHLVRLVDDLLDASRIATGKISLQVSTLDLHDVIDSALDIAQPALTARQQAVDVALPAAPVLLEGDAVRLAQLFSNLLLNASKFSAPGQAIALVAALGGGAVTVHVRDQGKGIAMEDQPHVFDLFAQGAEERIHGRAGGLGIGLTLVRSIAELHGGKVRLHSDGAGCGSQFTVVLPLSRDGRAQAAARPQATAQRLPI